MTNNELVTELARRIDTFQLSSLLHKLADLCGERRVTFATGSYMQNYLSNGQNCLEAASTFLAEAEREGLERQLKEELLCLRKQSNE